MQIVRKIRVLRAVEPLLGSGKMDSAVPNLGVGREHALTVSQVVEI